MALFQTNIYRKIGLIFLRRFDPSKIKFIKFYKSYLIPYLKKIKYQLINNDVGFGKLKPFYYPGKLVNFFLKSAIFLFQLRNVII